MRRELRVGQALGQQVQRFQNRQAGANQRDELLVEDQELLEVDLLLAAAHRHARDLAPRLDGVDQEALLREALAQVLFGGGFGHLLVDFAARIGVLEDELGHYCASLGATSVAPAGIWNLKRASFTGGFTFSPVELEREHGLVLAVDHQALDLVRRA